MADSPPKLTSQACETPDPQRNTTSSSHSWEQRIYAEGQVRRPRQPVQTRLHMPRARATKEPAEKDANSLKESSILLPDAG